MLKNRLPPIPILNLNPKPAIYWHTSTHFRISGKNKIKPATTFIAFINSILMTKTYLLRLTLLLCLTASLYACDDEESCPKIEWFQDNDEDGLGNPLESIEACEQPVGYVSNSDDNDDNLPCPVLITWYQDDDEDGLGNPNVTQQACEQPIGFVANSDDDDDSVFCPTLITWYLDADGDSLGNPAFSKLACTRPANYTDNNLDDNDALGNNNGETELLNEALADDGYILMNELATNNIRLISKDGTTRSVWDLGTGNALANDAELLNDGRFLSTLKINPTPLTQGGYGGKIEMRDANKNIIWEYTMSSLEALQHHDVEMLPSGNILVMAWGQKEQNEILEKGYSGTATTLNTESIYEINPNTNQIIWEWHVWDHLIQDHDANKDGFGVLSENPQKVNLNYITDTPEFMHANGIDYDEERDLIFISVRYYSEIWVIDHSTTTSEAQGVKGDLVYRFGNPETYNGTGPRLFYRQHQPNLLEGTQIGKGNILVFSNEHYADRSAILEVQLPSVLDFNNLASIVWEFSDPSLSSPILSGAERLPNGNTLISVGTQGTIWEVTPDKQVVWKFRLKNSPPRIWRSYSYEKNSAALQAIGL